MSEQSSYYKTLLVEQLLLARQRDQLALEASTKGIPVEVPITGRVISSAYEQLRNAAEYSEEHLLLQRAIKRFCKLNLFVTKQRADVIGREMIVELVQAGYLQNNRVGSDAVDQINQIIETFMTTYGHLRQARVSRETASEWVLAFISVEAENLLNPHSRQQATVFLAYQHFLAQIPRKTLMNLPSSSSYELCMYIAAHRALLKSDVDIIRHEVFTLNGLSPHDVRGFREYNEQIDLLFSCELTARLRRIVSRYGAPFRVLKSMIDERSDIAELLESKQFFMEAFRLQTRKEYEYVQKRLNRGLIKGVIFLVITKLIIGVAIEVPYDIIAHGGVGILPLGVNLLFPALYMAILKFGLHPPSAANAHKLSHYIETVLYGDPSSLIVVPPKRRRVAFMMRPIYILIFLAPILLTGFLLKQIGFNAVQMVIFFIFFSTATSLGFRLSAMVRELEITNRQTGFLSSMAEFFYLPFIMTGQWISRKYSKVNIVARFLDLAIELPLKAMLRLVRQWLRFLAEQRDELY